MPYIADPQGGTGLASQQAALRYQQEYFDYASRQNDRYYHQYVPGLRTSEQRVVNLMDHVIEAEVEIDARDPELGREGYPQRRIYDMVRQAILNRISNEMVRDVNYITMSTRYSWRACLVPMSEAQVRPMRLAPPIMSAQHPTVDELEAHLVELEKYKDELIDEYERTLEELQTRTTSSSQAQGDR